MLLVATDLQIIKHHKNFKTMCRRRPVTPTTTGLCSGKTKHNKIFDRKQKK